MALKIFTRTETIFAVPIFIGIGLFSYFLTLSGQWTSFIVSTGGLFIAGSITLMAVRWQVNMEKSLSDSRDEEILLELCNRIKLEMRDNKNLLVNRLIPTLNKSKTSREDIWIWSITIGDCMGFVAFRELARTGLQYKLPDDIYDAIFNGYSHLEGVVSNLKQGLAAHTYHTRVMGTSEEANHTLKYTLTLANTCKNVLDTSVQQVFAFNTKE